MTKNFLDADEDDSLITKESLKKEPESEKEFEEFAAPFSRIEEQETNLLEIPQSNPDAPSTGKNEENKEVFSEMTGEKTFEPESEIANDSSGEPEKALLPETLSESEPEKSIEEKFWEKQLETLKAENYGQQNDLQSNDLQSDDFQDDDFETFVRPKNGFEDFEPVKTDAAKNFETAIEDETSGFEPPVKEEQTGFILPNLEKDQSFSENNDEATSGANNVRRRDDSTLFSQSPYHSETPDETIRRSGLAYAAAIALFGSIVFTLILGWFVDLLLGTSPWGKVGGIVLGAVVGFIQFFRTTSDIFKNKN